MVERERGAGQPIDDRRNDGSRSEPIPDVNTGSVSSEEAEFQRQMEVGCRGMRKHRNVLAALAEEMRHQRVMTSAERVMRKHRNVFAMLSS